MPIAARRHQQCQSSQNRSASSKPPLQDLPRRLVRAVQQPPPTDWAASVVDPVVVAIDRNGIELAVCGLQQGADGPLAQAVVGIEKDQPFAAGCAGTSVAGGGYAGSLIDKKANRWTAEAVKDCKCFIRRAVVNDDQLVYRSALSKDALDSFADEARRVPGGHDYRNGNVPAPLP